jgi:hypothetical protein
MQLELLTFRKIHPKDAKEYRDAIHESQDSVGVFKSSLIDDVGVGKRRIALGILAGEAPVMLILFNPMMTEF